jgi:hypothetical protein
MTLSWSETTRGFTVAEFRDLYDQDCSIQASSLATQPAIWFGVDNALWPSEYDTMPLFKRNGDNYRHVNARMHLSRERAAELWPALKTFAETGDLLPPEAAS